MKEPYGKGLAAHPGPESCAGHGNMAGEALTKGRTGSEERGRTGSAEERGHGRTGRVAPGDCSPGAPTDPDVQNYRIRFLR